jgi:hypothetical protein
MDFGLSDRTRSSALLNRYVAAAFVVQTVSYAVLVGFLEHGDVTPLVALTRRLPTALAAILGAFAVPALLVALLVGVVVESAFGISLRNVGVGLVSGSDIPFLVAVSLLSVGVVGLVRRRRRRALGA